MSEKISVVKYFEKINPFERFFKGLKETNISFCVNYQTAGFHKSLELLRQKFFEIRKISGKLLFAKMINKQ